MADEVLSENSGRIDPSRPVAGWGEVRRVWVEVASRRKTAPGGRGKLQPSKALQASAEKERSGLISRGRIHILGDPPEVGPHVRELHGSAGRPSPCYSMSETVTPGL